MIAFLKQNVRLLVNRSFMHNRSEFMTQQKILRSLGLTLEQGLSSCMKRSNERTAVNGRNNIVIILCNINTNPKIAHELKENIPVKARDAPFRAHRLLCFNYQTLQCH